MSYGAKLTVTVLLLTLLTGLGAADYLFSGDEYASITPPPPPASEPGLNGGVAKAQARSVEELLAEAGLEAKRPGEETLLEQVSDRDVESVVVLSNGDRAGAVAWIESPRVKSLFIALKDALLPSFSDQMRDLHDETVQPNAGPVVNTLSFTDPGLSEERIVFVRVRERLYEFHIAEGKEEPMEELIRMVSSGA